MNKIKFKSGESVKVISGKFCGKVSKIFKVNRKEGLVYFEEFFNEKFVKNESGSSSDSEPFKKKKILIPINISNIKKISEVS